MILASFKTYQMLVICLFVVITSCKTNNKQDLNQRVLNTPNEELNYKLRKMDQERRVGKRPWLNTDNGIEGFIDFDRRVCEKYKDIFEHLTYPRYAYEYESDEMAVHKIGSLAHYYAVEDLLALYSADSLSHVFFGDSSIRDTASMAIWRLYMFYPLSDNELAILEQNKPSCSLDMTDLAYHRFRMLHLRIDSLLNYKPFYGVDFERKRNLAKSLYRLYSQEVYKALEYSQLFSREDTVRFALYEEEEAFLKYLECAKRTGKVFFLGSSYVLNFPESHNSVWKCEDYILDNWKIRTLSLQYYMFSLYCYSEFNSIDGEYPLTRFGQLSEADVLKEYNRFARSLKEEEVWVDDSLGVVSSVQERKEALSQEKEAWTNWMKARRKLALVLEHGSWLNENDNVVIDISNRNILYRKWIQLNNQFNNFGAYDDVVEKCLLNDNCSISDLRKTCFADRWIQNHRQI